jgi:hypothetical protein
VARLDWRTSCWPGPEGPRRHHHLHARLGRPRHDPHYDVVIVPLLDEALRARRRLRCLVEGDSIEGITPAAAFEDATLGMRALGSFEGCAVVTGLPWIGDLTRFAAFLMPYPLRVFSPHQRVQAIAWLGELNRWWR